ncbi:MAG: hypothetical protein A2Y80_10460 [Deltaproteobacteria bacterium RBG_13_58_19]|nr:MAG: hypothetical protein A2Y80_10460 [Deltaproteobacteria bacterium RBG_13_58_19]
MFPRETNLGHTQRLTIADFTLEAELAGGTADLHLSEAHRRFQANGGQADIHLRFHYGGMPDFPRDAPIFVSGGPWSLYRRDSRNHIVLALPDTGRPPYRLAELNSSFSSGNVYVRPLEEAFPEHYPPGRAQGPTAFDPFEYPLDELIMVNYLAQGRGVIFHALGLVDQGRGWLFVGVSGAGKSTMAALWKESGALLLSDDRIIVRPREGCFWMYGTPWHGDGGIGVPDGAPLERIFFLAQTPENRVQSLTIRETATRLLVCCFPPFYDPAGMAFTLELLGEIAEATPVAELGFVPDPGVVEFVRGAA